MLRRRLLFTNLKSMMQLAFNRSYKLLCSIVVICLIASCRNDGFENYFQTTNDAANGYQADQQELEENGVHIAFNTRTDFKNGELVLMMKIKNNSDRSIGVDYRNCVLSIDDERVAVPRIMKPYRETIPADDEETYEISFA